MDIQALREKTGEAERRATKQSVRDTLAGALSQVVQREKNRLSWLGKAEAAEQAARIARAELGTAESNLQKAVSELEDLIAKV